KLSTTRERSGTWLRLKIPNCVLAMRFLPGSCSRRILMSHGPAVKPRSQAPTPHARGLMHTLGLSRCEPRPPWIANFSRRVGIADEPQALIDLLASRHGCLERPRSAGLSCWLNRSAALADRDRGKPQDPPAALRPI